MKNIRTLAPLFLLLAPLFLLLALLSACGNKVESAPPGYVDPPGGISVQPVDPTEDFPDEIPLELFPEAGEASSPPPDGGSVFAGDHVLRESLRQRSMVEEFLHLRAASAMGEPQEALTEDPAALVAMFSLLREGKPCASLAQPSTDYLVEVSVSFSNYYEEYTLLPIPVEEGNGVYALRTYPPSEEAAAQPDDGPPDPLSSAQWLAVDANTWLVAAEYLELPFVVLDGQLLWYDTD